MAESLLREELSRRGVDVRVRSAGLLTEGEPASARAVEVLADRGLDLAQHRSRRLVEQLVREADLVITMERAHVREVVLLCRDAFPRAFTLKELVRRGEAAGKRGPDETIEEWLHRVHAGRKHTDHLGAARHDDVSDPIGRPRSVYDKVVAELDDLVRRLVDLLWAEG